MRLQPLFPVLLVGLGLSLASCDPEFLRQLAEESQDPPTEENCTDLGVTEDAPEIANTIDLVKGDEWGNHGTYEDPDAPGIALPVYEGADFTFNGRVNTDGYFIPRIPIPRSSDNPPEYWNWTIPWGTVYYPAGVDDRPEGLRIEVRNLRSYYFNQEQLEWVQIDSTDNGIAGAFYVNDFANDANVEADITTHNEQGSISVSIPPIGDVFHFFRGGQNTRQPVNDPANCVGFYTACEARLVRVGDCADNRENAELYLGMGLDIWATEDADGNDPAFEYHQDAFFGRHRQLNANWQTYNGVALINTDEINLDAYPPPLN